MVRKYLISFILASILKDTEAAEWNHDMLHPYGPAHWADHFPQCGGKSQSPIQIRKSTTVHDSRLGEFKYVGYDRAASRMQLVNNRHAAQVNILDNNPQISGAGLGSTYTLKQFHFHSGRDHSRGSEHLVDNDKYASEIHFVHTNDAVADDKLMTTPGGIAVIGVLLKAEGEYDHPGYNKITKYLDRVINGGAETEMEPFAIDDLLPADHHHYYRYNGSLTTPNCNEIVIWTIYKNHVTLSDRQIEKFRVLVDHNGKPLLDTHRPPLALNGRTVYASFQAPPTEWPSAAPGGYDMWMLASLIVTIVTANLL